MSTPNKSVLLAQSLGLFKKIDEVKPGSQSSWLTEGVYMLMIDKVKFDNVQSGLAWFNEFTVLAVLDKEGVVAPHREREAVTHMISMRFPSSAQDIAGFIMAIMMVPKATEQDCFSILGDDQPLAGQIVIATGRIKPTKENKKPFNKIRYRRASADEIRQHVSPEVRKDFGLTDEKLAEIQQFNEMLEAAAAENP